MLSGLAPPATAIDFHGLAHVRNEIGALNERRVVTILNLTLQYYRRKKI